MNLNRNMGHLTSGPAYRVSFKKWKKSSFPKMYTHRTTETQPRLELNTAAAYPTQCDNNKNYGIIHSKPLFFGKCTMGFCMLAIQKETHIFKDFTCDNNAESAECISFMSLGRSKTSTAEYARIQTARLLSDFVSDIQVPH